MGIVAMTTVTLKGHVLKNDIKYGTRLGEVISEKKDYVVSIILWRDDDETSITIELSHVNKSGVLVKKLCRNQEVTIGFARYLRAYASEELIKHNSLKASTEQMLEYISGNKARVERKQNEKNL